MIKQLAQTAGKWVERAGNKAILGLFLLGSFFIRLPFFFRDYVDRDESTFILVAQSVVDGHLPYTELWDLKPPLLFLIFAVPIYLFGKSLLAIRLVGWLATGLISYYTFRLGEKASDRTGGFVAGLFCMFLMSLFNSVQGVMSEHLSMVFLMPAAYVLARGRGAADFFLAGFLCGLAVLCKSNLAVTLVVVGIFLLVRKDRDGRFSPGAALLTAAGGTLAILASLLPYVLTAQQGIWWESVVAAPLAYSGEQEGVALKNLPFYLGIALLLFLGWKYRWYDLRNRVHALVWVFLIGILLAFLKGGKINGHYLLQFYPFFLVLLFAGLQQGGPAIARNISAYFWVLLALLPVESYLEYAAVYRNYREKGLLYNGEGVDVPRYMETRHPGETDILYLEYHIGYWLMDMQPPAPVLTHPTNICRGELYPYIPGTLDTPESELRYLFEESRPGWVICREGKPPFAKWYPQHNAYVENYLSEHYRVETRIGRAIVYRRL